MPEQRQSRQFQARTFMDRPFTGTVTTLIAIDKEMRSGAAALAGAMPPKLSEDVRLRLARARVRRYVDSNWRLGETDGSDLLAWLKTVDWTTATTRSRR